MGIFSFFNKSNKMDRDEILEVIYQAVDLMRAGKFNQANKIYIDLDKANPNNPTILKSWAKIIVCLGDYTVAVDKYNQAITFYELQGNDG